MCVEKELHGGNPAGNKNNSLSPFVRPQTSRQTSLWLLL